MVRFWLKEILLSLLKIKHFNIIHDTSTKIETLLHFLDSTDLITHMLILFGEGGGASPCIETRVNSTTYFRIIIKLCHLASKSHLNLSCHYCMESEVCRYPLQTTCVSLGGKEGSLTKLGKKNLDFFYFCDVTRLNVHFFLLVVLPFKFFLW